VEIELRGGPLDGERRRHPLHPVLFGQVIRGTTHVWAREKDQAWAPPDPTVAVYDYQGPLYHGQ
jgi:hypothetical protein